MNRCSTCGLPVADHDRDIRFRLPDLIASAPGQETSDRVRMDDPDPNRAVMIDTRDQGSFIRALLQVHLTGGHLITYGVWVGVDYDDLGRAAGVWNEPEYAELRMEGNLANRIDPWGLADARVTLGVLDTEHTPYIVDSTDDNVRAVLEGDWEHQPVLAVLSEL